ncbi:MAG TPA: FtsX-like permease family protein [Ignavibacteria bacterium]
MKSAEFFIARRYLFSKRKLNFITIITLISVIGVSIGVAAMIIVLSVFNGFNKKVTDILIGFDPHIRIEAKSGHIDNYNGIYEKIQNENISEAAPYILSKGMLANKSFNKVCFIKGTDENKISKVSGVKNVTKLGKFDLSDHGNYGSIVLGIVLADQMRSLIGDTMTLLSPFGLENSLTQFVEPITKQFIVKGIYDSDNKEYDSKYAYISIENARELFKINNEVDGIEIRLNNINEADNIKSNLASKLDSNLSIMTWYDLHSDFYSILKIERWVAFIILSLIILVATFNILGSLTMTVIEKKRDIGILKAMGSSDKQITKIFLFEGVVVGLIGMIAGSALGLILTLLQKYYGIYKLNASVYKVDALPVELRLTDFIFIPLAALLLCFLASLYPSKRAAKIDPVKSIRWE